MRFRRPALCRVGLIARADNRGLGHLTWEFARALQPASTMIVSVDTRSRFVNHFDRYDPAALVVRWDHTPTVPRFVGDGVEAAVKAWLATIDVLYSAETFYDWRIVDWARDAGVRTVLHVMPELLPTVLPSEPSSLWAPTGWRLDHLPAGTPFVPVPVAADRFTPAAWGAGPLRVLHIAGHRAAADRNGTVTLLRALRQVTEPMTVTIATQDGRLPHVSAPRCVTLRTRLGSAAPAHYWEQYGDADLLVMPRRYGGLSLPVQEAAAAGLGIVLPATAPNDGYPAMLVPCRESGTIETAAGHVPIVDTDPAGLAARLDHLARTPEAVEAMQVAARSWAAAHSWLVWRDRYLDLLGSA